VYLLWQSRAGTLVLRTPHTAAVTVKFFYLSGTAAVAVKLCLAVTATAAVGGDLYSDYRD